MREAEAPGFLLAQDDPRNEEAADDEENIDAEIAARETGDVGMKEENSPDGDGAQAVNLGPVCVRRHEVRRPRGVG